MSTHTEGTSAWRELVDAAADDASIPVRLKVGSVEAEIGMIDVGPGAVGPGAVERVADLLEECARIMHGQVPGGPE